MVRFARLMHRHVGVLGGPAVHVAFGDSLMHGDTFDRRGFRQEWLPGSEPWSDPLYALARIYREFALANPPLYALMFERPLPDFDPSPQLRSQALGMTFGLLVAEVDAAAEQGLLATSDPARVAYLIWTAIHGMVSIELTHAVRSPLPGWFLDRPEVGDQLLVEGVTSLLDGLGVKRREEPSSHDPRP